MTANNNFVFKMKNNQDDFCGTFFAAKMLSLSVGTVQSLVERGELKAWKTQGGHRRISMQSVRDYHSQNGLPDVVQTTDRYRVLVVEDDAATLELLRAAINGWNLPIDLTTMGSALEALIDINSLRPDLLITDLQMPGVNGFELLRTLRGNTAFASMVVVTMSGLSQSDTLNKGGLPPNTVQLQKPIDMGWLNGFVTALLTRRDLDGVR
jgi:excisionase family DNA binding protein